RATASPMPLAAPVTTATFPSIFMVHLPARRKNAPPAITDGFGESLLPSALRLRYRVACFLDFSNPVRDGTRITCDSATPIHFAGLGICDHFLNYLRA